MTNYDKVLGGGYVPHLNTQSITKNPMRTMADEYPAIEKIWLSKSPAVRRFKLEDKLTTYTKHELEQLELFIWAQLQFGNTIKDYETGKAIHAIVEQVLEDYE